MHTSPSNSDTPSGIAGLWRQQQQRQLLQHSGNAAPKWTLFSQVHGYLRSDLHLHDSATGWWTPNKTDAQVYYDSDNAQQKAKLLAELIGEPIELQSI